MIEIAQQKSIVKVRDLAVPPEKVWRALTESHLLREWLMDNTFRPVVGHRFDLTADWGSISCQVLAVEAARLLSYSWDAHGLESTVTWTLAKTPTGTRLTMEQIGFKPDQTAAYRGARDGWDVFLQSLESTLSGLA